MTSIPSIETTVHKTHKLLNQIASGHELIADTQAAYDAFNAVMTTLRDRLTLESAHAIGAQLTPLARGFYYEGWQPGNAPQKLSREEFEAVVTEKLSGQYSWPVGEIIRVVILAVGATIEPQTLQKLAAQVPDDVAALFA